MCIPLSSSLSSASSVFESLEQDMASGDGIEEMGLLKHPFATKPPSVRQTVDSEHSFLREGVGNTSDYKAIGL